jgi:hypothetical protein
LLVAVVEKPDFVPAFCIFGCCSAVDLHDGAGLFLTSRFFNIKSLMSDMAA